MSVPIVDPKLRGLRVNNKLWILSDTHFGHKNIIKFQQRPESHDIMMLSNWIDRVGEEDQLLHLGDVCLGKQGNPLRWAKVIGRLPGEKFLIKGNHDKQKDSVYEGVAGFKIIPPFIHKLHVFTHEPVSIVFPGPSGPWYTNIHGHIHGNSLAEAAEYEANGLEYIYERNKKYINVCVEVMDYAPVQLGQIWTQPK